MTVLKKIGQDIAGQMPAVDKKRLLMMNIPYVIVFYLADKLAWLYRFCVGESAIERLGVLFLNFQMAFSKRISKSISQLIISPLEQHSKKPDEVRKRIVELFGELPRIELFARQKTSGWDVWGNEVEGSASSRILENAGKGDGNRGICISTQRFDKGKK